LITFIIKYSFDVAGRFGQSAETDDAQPTQSAQKAKKSGK